MGVDGTRGGWVAVTLDAGVVRDVGCVPDLSTLVEQVGDVPIAVDIPIGLIDGPRRAADAAARALLSGRSSSVFPAPCRAVVDGYRAGTVTDHATANALSRREVGAGLSAQTWNIVDKVAEADALVDRGVTLYEVHPELAFRLCAGRSLPRKRSWNGVTARLDLLRRRGVVLPAVIDGGDRLPIDDVVDAAVAAWTAAGLHDAAGLRPHPDPVQEWDRGRPIAIWTRP